MSYLELEIYSQKRAFTAESGYENDEENAHFRPPKTARRVVDSHTDPNPRPTVEPILPNKPLEHIDRLCPSCAAMDFCMLITRESKIVGQGLLLECYRHEACPFCRLILGALCEAWGPEWSNSDHLTKVLGGKVQYFLKSKCWASIAENGKRNQKVLPRLILATTHSPRQLYHDRPAIGKADRKLRFIVGEIEYLSIAGHVFPTAPSSNPLGGDSRLMHSIVLSRKTVGARFDVRLVRGWLDACDRHSHGIPRPQPVTTLLNSGWFRVVDLQKGCLVVQTTPCTYLTLSYAWGEPSHASFKLCRQNLPVLLSPGVLYRHNLGKNLPRTIQDMLSLAESLGERYVWIDALCIVQDDEEEKSVIIKGMDLIYESAYVTVIAGGGRNCNAGIPGITPRSVGLYDHETGIETPQGLLKLALCRPSLCTALRNSHWNTRAWTYQEESLSQRCLYFTESELFFVCREEQWREERPLESKPAQVKVRTGPPWWDSSAKDPDPEPSPFRGFGDLDRRNFSKYKLAVESFSRRDLTYEDGVLNAFTGVLNRFISDSPLSQDLTLRNGIPTHFLRDAILWQPSDPNKLRRRKCPTGSKPNVTFPSWSWAGWVGPVEFFNALDFFLPNFQFNRISQNKNMLGRYWLACSKGKFLQELQGEQHSHIQPWDNGLQRDFLEVLTRPPPMEVPKNCHMTCEGPATLILGFWTLCGRTEVRISKRNKDHWFNLNRIGAGRFDFGHAKLNPEWVHKQPATSVMRFIFVSHCSGNIIFTLLVEGEGEFKERVGIALIWTSFFNGSWEWEFVKLR